MIFTDNILFLDLSTKSRLQAKDFFTFAELRGNLGSSYSDLVYRNGDDNYGSDNDLLNVVRPAHLLTAVSQEGHH